MFWSMLWWNRTVVVSPIGVRRAARLRRRQDRAIELRLLGEVARDPAEREDVLARGDSSVPRSVPR
jgi:hypothetical protein